jgi:dipeptidyl aminopeptidase/acylaminoacyl peptidase
MKKISGLLTITIGLIALCHAVANQISLQYIQQKEFDGRNLRLLYVISSNEAYTRYYITYKSGSYKISGIMNVPKGEGPFPAIITNHGYIDTRYYFNGRGLRREQDYLARRGFVVLHPDYRNHAGSDVDLDNAFKLNLGYTEDVINAVYAIKNSSLKYIDKSKIGMLGHSLGGGIALNIMVTKPGLVNAYVLFAPTSVDFRDNYDRWIANRDPKIAQKFGTPKIRQDIIKQYGTTSSNPEFWDNLSPKLFISNIKDPVIVLQGTADESVPPSWARKLVEVFRKNNKTVKLVELSGQPHEFTTGWQQAMKITTAFFKTNLNVK